MTATSGSETNKHLGKTACGSSMPAPPNRPTLGELSGEDERPASIPALVDESDLVGTSMMDSELGEMPALNKRRYLGKMQITRNTKKARLVTAKDSWRISEVPQRDPTFDDNDAESTQACESQVVGYGN